MLRIAIVALLALGVAAVAGNALAIDYITRQIACKSTTFNTSLTPPAWVCVPVDGTAPSPPDPDGGGGGGTDPPPTTSCPADTLWVRGQWGNPTIYTTDYGNFNNQWLVVEIKPPAGWSSGIENSQWVEYIDGAPVRNAMFATQPCTFDPKYALKSGSGAAQRIVDQLGFTFKYKTGDPSSTAVVLTPGTTYYINAKNMWNADGSPSCTGSCNMRGSIND